MTNEEIDKFLMAATIANKYKEMEKKLWEMQSMVYSQDSRIRMLEDRVAMAEHQNTCEHCWSIVQSGMNTGRNIKKCYKCDKQEYF